MLVLSRHAGESLIIGDNIEISIISIQGDKVKIGVEAPKIIGILRKELIQEVTQINSEAASTEIDLDALADALNK